MTVEELTGTWKLVSFDLKTKTGEAYPHLIFICCNQFFKNR